MSAVVEVKDPPHFDQDEVDVINDHIEELRIEQSHLREVLPAEVSCHLIVALVGRLILIHLMEGLPNLRN